MFTVIISGMSYADVITRIRAWVSSARVGPVLVTDGVSGEELVSHVVRRKPAHVLDRLRGRDRRP